MPAPPPRLAQRAPALGAQDVRLVDVHLRSVRILISGTLYTQDLRV